MKTQLQRWQSESKYRVSLLAQAISETLAMPNGKFDFEQTVSMIELLNQEMLTMHIGIPYNQTYIQHLWLRHFSNPKSALPRVDIAFPAKHSNPVFKLITYESNK